ncbi:MAG: hypothetical protein ACU0BF_02735 [Paracoccaceae bacterium]
MIKSIIPAIAVLALSTSAAVAQEAFITQLGDDNQAANVSNGTTGRVNAGQQVIVQQGDELSAANLNRGFGNAAWAWQDNSNANIAGSGSITANSLILQSGPGAVGGTNNTAVNVQLAGTVSPGKKDLTMTAQTVQSGNGNVAINWTQRTNGIGAPVGTVAQSVAGAPTISSTPRIVTRPTGTVRTNGRPGALVVVRNAGGTN